MTGGVISTLAICAGYSELDLIVSDVLKSSQRCANSELFLMSWGLKFAAPVILDGLFACQRAVDSGTRVRKSALMIPGNEC
jgi:hypothetical protein